MKADVAETLIRRCIETIENLLQFETFKLVE